MDFNRLSYTLREYIGKFLDSDVAVAFSGGVDSALVLKIAVEEAKKRGSRVTALTFNTFLSPSADIEITRKLAKEYGVRLVEEYIDQTDNEKVLMNDVKRCFYCKYTLFSRAKQTAYELGAKYVFDGTNKSDLGVYRPGLAALKELGIISPLAECGFEKSDVRLLAAELGISVAKRPSAPCLATRFPYGSKLPLDKFEMVDTGEKLLRQLGFDVCRIRLYGDITRIEILPDDFLKFIKERESIIAGLKKIGFKYINLDIEGFRSGSMDEVIDKD
ncbi:hypothetical protein HMPREF9333_00295 [Johnsonella ignava ATCC 51276]|jgi:TIGR00268 family protein|uniref:tRNA(Ile)-lysidine/2-thiocytidine synthase N-terminal domain-containing protein n=1 Tax=Johnsonella ignava ATCC 51276 TaxID=679200 RepID=G5GFF6_9FIRM|nr:ATP-dependent sacrificial sulfur transferase LarE [Johnsonella ignava]EHI56433.1 hypothetical protein HMPREF9333_00295 [Johnsonella ignava ATCC 51276]